MPKGSTQRLCDGDSIQFGLQWNIWRLVHEPMVVVMSTLTGTQKKEVRDIVGKLGGHIVSCWKTNCTHLTMSTFTMTVKAIIALAHGKAIVVPEFWKKFMMAVHNKTELPKYEDFLPPLAETIINKSEVSFIIKPERSQLFQGKEFLFFTEQQHNEYACLVTAAGGTASILDLERTPEAKLIEPHIIVMQRISNPSCQVSQTPQAFTEVISFLQSHGKRVIPVSEIGLAILHCSMEKYCNPSFSFASTMLSSCRNTVHDLTSQETLALETQESETNRRSKRHNHKGNLIIPESGTVSKHKSLSPKKEDSELRPVLPIERIQSTQEKHSEKIEVSSEEELTSNRRFGSQKRPQSKEDEEVDINRPPKKRATKDSGQVFRSKVCNNDDDGLFDFISEKTTINKSDQEDLFAFKEPVTIKVETTHDDEDMFSFNTTQNLEKGGMTSSDLSDVALSTSKGKRKLSLGENNCKSDQSYKRMALENGYDEFQHESQDFLSTSNVKREKSTDYAVHDDACNSTVVIVKPLVTAQTPSQTKTPEESISHNAKNFKKFHKVQNRSISVLPRIIGCRDMVPFSKNTVTAAISSLFNNDEDIDDENDERDDWAFQTVSQTKMKGRSRRL
ncbi:nibrin isoform X2 [Anabrus simplex]